MFQPGMVAMEAAPEDSDGGKSSHISHDRPLMATGNLVKSDYFIRP